MQLGIAASNRSFEKDTCFSRRGRADIATDTASLSNFAGMFFCAILKSIDVGAELCTKSQSARSVPRDIFMRDSIRISEITN